MASPAELRRRIRALIDDMEPSVRDAFEASIADIRSKLVLQHVVDALQAHDTEAAIAALHIEPAAFAPLKAALDAAYNAGGVLTAQLMPTMLDLDNNKVLVRWDVSNPRAEAEIRDYSSQLIKYVTEDTKQTARETILAGYAKGQGPRQIGVDLAGRINRATGQRDGGVLGLTPGQAQAADNLRARLLSGDPAEMRKVLGMNLRDKRYDKTIQAAIAAEKPLTKEQADKMFQAYNNKALKFRADMVARTETGAAVSKSSHEAFRQGLEKSGRSESAVTRVWRSAGDKRVRHSHEELNGQKVRGLSQPFVSPLSGARMMYPLDSSLGAPASELIQCRCLEELNIDFSQGLR